MKFYFAGSFKRRAELIGYMEELEAVGHVVTSRWLKSEHEVDVITDAELSPDGPAYRFAQEDIEDVQDADALVFFSSAGFEYKGRGGRHTEFGLAIGIHKPILFIGKRECAFHALVPDRNLFLDFRQFMIGLEYVIDEVKLQIEEELL